MANYRLRTLSALLIAVLLLACSACAQRQDPDPAEPPLSVSEEAAVRLEAKLGALAGPEFYLEITDEEATSYAALRLAGSIPLTAPEVRFQPERIVLQGELTAPVRVHVVLSGALRTRGGRIELSLQEARLDRLSIPHFLLASLADSLSEMANDSLGHIEVQSIEITSGRVVVRGVMHNP